MPQRHEPQRLLRVVRGQGGISVLAEAGFIAQSGGSSSVAGLAGYAVLGGIFFLVSAVRLRRVAGRPA